MAFPEWALKHKRKGTELRCIRGKYYLYEVTSQWDKVKKRAIKKTGKCVGAIYEDKGLIPSKSKASVDLEKIDFNPKVFGAFYLFKDMVKLWEESLKRHFPDYWQQIICMVYARLFKRSPIKNMNFFYEKSMLSNYFEKLEFSDKKISSILKEIGNCQDVFESFMREFINDEDVVMVDATPIFTKSKNIHEARLGYNNKKQWITQVNLMYLYSSKYLAPLFFKLSAGDIREVKTFQHALWSSGIKNAVIIGDKGFTSRTNLEIMEEGDFNYILPLKRNDSFIDYSDIPTSKALTSKYFKFKDKYIWYYSKEIENGRRVTVYIDDNLKLSEEHDYLDRIETQPEKYTQQGFYENRHKMGTLALVDNLLDKSEEEIYLTYKSRCEIEQLFDIFKNELEADRTYMQSFESLKGFMFINHLAIVCYYQIYKLLKQNKLLSNHSVNDILEFLYHINAININGKWYIEKISEKNNKLLKQMNIELPITWERES